MPEPRAEIGELWRTVNHEIHDRFRQAFRGCDLPVGALILLRLIAHEPGMTVSEVARRSGMVKSHVSNVVEQLVRRDYVEKRPDTADLRLLRVYAKQGATGGMAEMEDRAHSVWSAVMDEVPEGQLADVAHGLRILLAALQKSRTVTDQSNRS